MKTFRVTIALLLLTVTLRAQDAVPPNPVPAAPAAALRTPDELDQLLGPIALYPDALIALILPASTVPTDIVLAARHLRENPGDRSQIEHRAWDESVKSLTNYPEVVQWMDENLHWTRQVGEAFAVQPAEVMQSIQRLRAKASAAGTLVDTPQQQVIAEPQVIRIVPAQPDIIYVPHYEPEIVFVDRPVYFPRPFLTFGIGVPVGSWLAFDCDWRHNSIWVGNRHRRWIGHDWRRPVVPISPGYAHTRSPDVRQWRPPSHSVRPPVTVGHRFRSEIARPAPFGLAASRAHTYRDSSPATRRSSFDSSSPVSTLPRTSTSGFRNESVRPRVTTPVVAPPLPTARVITSPTPRPAIQPPVQTRRFGNDGVRGYNRPRSDTTRDDHNRSTPGGTRDYSNRSTPGTTHDFGNRDRGNRSTPDATRDYGNHSRTFRNHPQPAVTTAPIHVVPALPRANPPHVVQPGGSTSQRSYSRPTSSHNQVTTPIAPRQHRPAAPAAVAPVAPQVAPQPAPVAPAQAAPAQRSGGESRGHRGAVIRRNSS